MALARSRPRLARRTLLAGIAGALACARPTTAARAPLMVAAAMSLREVMEACEREFEAAHPRTDVVLDLAGSHALAAQILEGAGVDVFLSADAKQMDRLAAAGLVGASTVFAHNRLVVIGARGVELAGPEALARPGLKLILAGPEVPAGAYAREALDRLGIRAAALANLVSEEENVRSVVHKVSLGEADAGIVYATDVVAAAPGTIEVVELPESASIRALYYAAVVRATAQPAIAAAFVSALHEPPARTALIAAGFSPV